MVSEPSALSNQTKTSYNFVTPVKLDQNNFIIWRTQVLTSIKGNGLEGFITGENKCPDPYLVQGESVASSSNTRSGSRIENPAFSTWIRTNQLILSWMMSYSQLCFPAQVSIHPSLSLLIYLVLICQVVLMLLVICPI